MDMLRWVRLPSEWMACGGLKAYKWAGTHGSSEAAALMVYLVIAHRASLAGGFARLTYDQLTTAAGISRTKVSDGLDILQSRGLIEREPEGRSTFQISNYDPSGGWCQVPAKPLYAGGAISAFRDFNLRKVAELDALKCYLAFAARRDTDLNRAHMTYPQIYQYTGIPVGRIKAAVSLLVVNSLVAVDQHKNRFDHGLSLSYRLRGLYPRNHRGTTGRREMETEGFI